jgi:hypothetical protein
MTTKGWIVAVLLIIGVLLFLVVGFDVATWKDHNLVALGLAAITGSFLVHLFMGGPELKG